MASRSGAKGSGARGGAAGPDVLEQLEGDHRRVQQLLDDFEDSEGDEAEQIELAQQICDELRVHARLEEEIFYPAARQALDDDGVALLDEALVEHGAAEDLIAKVEASDPSDELFRAQVKVLGAYVEHHIVEEESELFALVRESSLDRGALGAELQARREAMLADMGLDPEVDEDEDEEEDEEEDEDEDETLAAAGETDDATDDAPDDEETGEEAMPTPPRGGKGRGSRGSRPTAH